MTPSQVFGLEFAMLVALASVMDGLRWLVVYLPNIFRRRRNG